MLFLTHSTTGMPSEEPNTSRKGSAKLSLTWALPFERWGLLAVAGNPLVQLHAQLTAFRARQNPIWLGKSLVSISATLSL